MPFRLDEHRAKIAFVTSARTPTLIYRACTKRGLPSNTAYLQRAVAEALSRDLDIPLDELLDELPPLRGSALVLFGDDRRRVTPMVGPANTIESVQ